MEPLYTILNERTTIFLRLGVFSNKINSNDNRIDSLFF